MTNMNPVELIKSVDHAAGMNDRWLFIASLALLGIFGVWVVLMPLLGWSTNLVGWSSVTGAPTWWPATNRAEFFRVNRLLMERVMVP